VANRGVDAPFRRALPQPPCREPPLLAEAAGYYYGLLHFLVTPLVLAWLYLRRPTAFPRLRSALVLATAAANAVFWAWPVAPPGSRCGG
jgi:uncharacterized membrane protein YhhN